MKRGLVLLLLVAVATGGLMLGGWAVAAEEEPAPVAPPTVVKEEPGAKPALCQAHAEQCMKLMKELGGLLESARAKADAGDAKAAGAEVAKAQAVLTQIHEQMKACPMGQAKPVVNARCPMEGAKLDPAKVTPELTRQFKGHHVGFCCAACPAAWDKLDDTQKQAKLDAAMEQKP